MKAMGASRGLHWCVGNCVRRIREGYVTGITWSAVGMRAVGRRWGNPKKRIGDDSEYGETTVEGLRLSGEGLALTPVPGRKVVYAHGWRGIPIWGSRSRGPLERFRRYSVGLGAARLSRTLVAAAMTTPGEM